MRSEEDKLKDSIELCNEILPLFEGHRLHIALNAVMFAATELLMNYSPTLETAIEQLDELYDASKRSLEAYDNDNGPQWRRKPN